MRLLVTGGAGFIGSNLALELEKLGHQVIVYDNLSSGSYANLKGFTGEFIADDISMLTYSRLLDIAPDAIFHQAAITDTTLYDEKLMLKINLSPMEELLRYAKDKKAPLIYASSAAVYGSAPSPQKEKDAGSPLNIYGFSKWMCDCQAMQFMKNYPKSQVVGLRYFNVFGPNEQNKGKMASMVYQLTLQIKSGKKPRIFKHGEQKRDFVYVKDVVQANLLALKSGKSGIFNVGSGKARSFNDVCASIFDALGAKGEIDYIDNPYVEKYQSQTEASLTNSKSQFGYSPTWKLEKAIEDYMNHLKLVRVY